MDDQVYTGINILEPIKWWGICLIKQERGGREVSQELLTSQVKCQAKIISGIGTLQQVKQSWILL